MKIKLKHPIYAKFGISLNTKKEYDAEFETPNRDTVRIHVRDNVYIGGIAATEVIFGKFVPSNLEWDDIEIGKEYNVMPDKDDTFITRFVGTAIDKTATFIVVEDNEGDLFQVHPNQLTHNTDAIMHD